MKSQFNLTLEVKPTTRGSLHHGENNKKEQTICLDKTNPPQERCYVLGYN